MGSKGTLDDEVAAGLQQQARQSFDPTLELGPRTDQLTELLAKLADTAGFGAAEQGDARGTVDAHVMLLTLPTATVEPLLPRGLDLGPQAVVHHHQHPVFVMLSTETLEGWFGDRSYRELTIGIPFVQRTDLHIPHRGPFIYLSRVCVDDPRVRQIGNLVYGQEKVDGEFVGTEVSTAIELTTGEPVAHFHSEPEGEFCRPHDLTGFEAVRPIFDMPVVAQGTRIYEPDAWSERDEEGWFLCANRRIDFDDPEAQIRPTRCTLHLRQGLRPRGLPTEPFSSAGLVDGELVSFQVRAPLSVSAPGSCSDTYFPLPTPPKKQRVVVLGGGAAACAAAFYLAQQRDRYQVEMYTRGWRLGGKCAAGRGEGYSERIEEHGLHAFVGFYENVFRTMREVYETAELPLSVGDDPYDSTSGEGPLAAAFYGKLDVGLMDVRSDRWQFFETGQRFDGRIPGTIPRSEADELPGVGQILLAVCERIRVEIDKMRGRQRGETALVYTRQTRENTWWRRLFAWLRRLVGLPPKSSSELGALLDRFTDHQQELLVERIGDMLEQRHPAMWALAKVFRGLRALLKRSFADDIESDPEMWFTWANLDVVLTVAVGIIESATVNADDLDDQDFRQWLLDHGMDPANKDIASVTMVYNTLYANEPGPNGEVQPGNLACGVALRWFLLLGFGYKGFPAYDFRQSCPQTMFTPYYRALTKLGVKIHFFHEVTELMVEGDGISTGRLTGVRMRQQARVKEGSDAYRPLLPPGRRLEVDGQPAWPLHPLWDQLHDEDREALQRDGINLEDSWSPWEGVGDVTLTQGEDFDLCILGIALGALRGPARRLYDPEYDTANPEWTAMMRALTVTPTASFQLWFDRPWDELYSGPHRDLLTGYIHPWPSLGDLTHVVQYEGWPTENTPKFLAYHTGAGLPAHPFDEHPADQHDYPGQEQSRQTTQMKSWLREHYAGMYDRVDSWPDFLASLTAPPGHEGEDRLDFQYFHAAVQPSDLYVLSPTGSTQHRLGQGESGYRHLFLCGDWTRTSMNCGCVEAATQSGMLAAKVISTRPSFIWSPGF